MAMATALMLGVAVEAGRVNGKVRTFLTIQEVCYYGSNILAGILGGYLCHTLVPVKALHIAALVAVFPVLIMSLLSATLLDEKRSDINAEGLKETVTSLRAAVVSPALWLVAAFSFGWSFMPVFGVPLYFHESKTLGFSQTVIGQLAAWNSAGMLLGALLYPRCIKVLSQKMQLFLTTAMCSLSVISYLLLSTPESAVLLEIFRGVSNVIAILLIYSLAADVCPRRIEVSVMALLVAIRNIATNLSTFTGGQLFTYVFAGQFPSLVLVSVLAPLLCALIVPLVCKYREIEMSARSLAENS